MRHHDTGGPRKREMSTGREFYEAWLLAQYSNPANRWDALMGSERSAWNTLADWVARSQELRNQMGPRSVKDLP